MSDSDKINQDNTPPQRDSSVDSITESAKETASTKTVTNIDVTAKTLAVPVSVVLQKRMIEGKFWSVPSWSLEAVLVGHEISGDVAGEPLHQNDESGEQGRSFYLWGGYTVTLYKDACERYWHALIGDQPLVYVVLREDEADNTIEPALVTIDYDEATAHSETDAEVLTAEIPGELYRLMERYVMQHYRPEGFKKRKRKNWSETESSDVGNTGREERLDPWDEQRRFRRPGYHGPH